MLSCHRFRLDFCVEHLAHEKLRLWNVAVALDVDFVQKRGSNRELKAIEIKEENFFYLIAGWTKS